MPALQNKDLYEAALAAFTLIACADGELHAAELSRFAETVAAEPALAQVTEEQLHDDVSDRRRRFEGDFKKAHLDALGAVEAIRDDAQGRDIVLKIARLALISDEKIHESEEAMLADIHRALGVTE